MSEDKPQDIQEHVSKSEAARFLGVSQRFIDRLTAASVFSEIYGCARSPHRTRYGYTYEDFYKKSDLEQLKNKLNELRKQIRRERNVENVARPVMEDLCLSELEVEEWRVQSGKFIVAPTDADEWPDVIGE